MRKTRIWFRGLVVGVMVLFGASLSCTPSAPVPEVTFPSGVTKPYGSLTIGAGFPGGPLDPLYSSGVQFNMLGSAIWDSLLQRGADSPTKPGIAERWEIARDGLTHTFYLRKGVKFHDGTDLTAADVKFSIERMISPKSITSASSGVWRDAIDRVEVKDDFTVAMHLKTPSYMLLPNIADTMGPVMPKKIFDEKGEEYFQKTLVGSGPWKVVSFRPAQELVLEAVDSHWRELPKFKNLTVRNVPEDVVKIALLRTGELDMAVVPSDAIPALRAAGLGVLSYDAGIKIWGPVFYDVNNPRQQAAGDVMVRKALQLAINSQQIADFLFAGAANPIWFAYAPPHVEKKMKPDPFDPEGAKRLLAESGYPAGFSMKLIDQAAGSVLTRVSEAVAGYWAKVGIQGTLVPMEQARFRASYRPTLDPSLFNSLALYRVAISNPETLSPATFHSKTATFKNINNPELDKMLERIPQTWDDAERERLNAEAVVLAKREYNVLSILAAHAVVGYGPKVGGVEPGGGGTDLLGVQLETIAHAK